MHHLYKHVELVQRQTHKYGASAYSVTSRPTYLSDDINSLKCHVCCHLQSTAGPRYPLLGEIFMSCFGSPGTVLRWDKAATLTTHRVPKTQRCKYGQGYISADVGTSKNYLVMLLRLPACSSVQLGTSGGATVSCS